jgi:hypothetical protein
MATRSLMQPRARGNLTTLPGFQGKRTTPLLAIQTFCRVCMGGNPLLVGACATTTCKFHQYRCGTIEAGADRRLLRLIKSYCAESCLPQEDATACVAGLAYLGMEGCSLWPYRCGKNPFYSAAAREKRREQGRKYGFGTVQDTVSRSRIDGSDPGHSSGHSVPQEGFLGEIHLRSPHAQASLFGHAEPSANTSEPMEASHA